MSNNKPVGSPVLLNGLSRRLSILRNAPALDDIPSLGSPPRFGLSPNRSMEDLPLSDHSASSSSENDGRLRKLLRSTSNVLNRSSENLVEPTKNDAVPMLDDLQISKPLDKRSIPPVLLSPGIEFLRITRRKKIKRLFRIDMDTNRLLWNNKASSYLSVDKIRNIRVGDDAKNYREEFKVSSDYKDLWITIIYHNEQVFNNIKALHMVATRKEDMDLFLSVMRNLLYFKVEMNKSFANTFNDEYLAIFHWNNNVVPYHPPVQSEESTTGDRLTYEGLVKLTKKLNINVDSEYLMAIFKQVDADHNGYLNFDEFKYFVKLLRQRNEVLDLFNDLSGGATELSLESFRGFVRFAQREQYDDETIDKLYAKFSQNGQMNSDEFTDFMVSSYTSPVKDIEENFSRPLNEYYIASSHNTYLLGRQIKGSSSVEGYIRALQRGCRCIEIDIWDGENESGEKCPVVTHGRTFTSSVNFRQVLEAIGKFAFITSPFPVILSLEVRCTYENQLKALEMMVDVLGDKLITTTLNETDELLPSPFALKHKFLVKVKKSTDSRVFSDSASSVSTPSSMSEDSLSSTTSTSSKIIPRRSKTPKISKELSSLGVYLVGTRFINFSLPESKTFNHCFSFSDRTLEKMLKDEEKLIAVLKHNRKYLLRIYPSQFRFNSSNFNPLPFWEVGVQMAATNWQAYDLGQQLNEAMFSVGSHSGYILKPSCLRPRAEKPKRKNLIELTSFNTVKEITVTILSAQQLPRPKELKANVLFDPYVELEVYTGKVLAYSTRSKLSSSAGEIATPVQSSQYPAITFTTPPVPKNGFNPVWNQECKLTLMTNQSDLTFLRFLVKCRSPFGQSDIVIAIHCCKLEYTKNGYRHLPLIDLQGEEYIFSSLFVKLDQTTL